MAYLSRASKFSFLLSSATQATSPCVAESKAVASLEMVMQGLQTLATVRLDCAYRFSRGQKQSHLLGPAKLFVLSLMVKMLLPVACQLVYSWLHSSKTDDIMELLLLLILQHRQKKPLPCHMIYTYNTNLIRCVYSAGTGTGTAI